MPAAGEISQAVAARYCAEKQRLKSHLAVQLKTSMAKLVGSRDFADVMLEANDGLRIPAHLCILKTRAPGFFRCYVEPILQRANESLTTDGFDGAAHPATDGSLTAVPINDVDGTSLKFFLRCIYTENDVPDNPASATPDRYPDREDGELVNGGAAPTVEQQTSVESQLCSVNTYTLENGNPMTSSELSDSVHTAPEDQMNSSCAVSDLSDIQLDEDASSSKILNGEPILMTSFVELASSVHSATNNDTLEPGSVSEQTAISNNDVSLATSLTETCQPLSESSNQSPEEDGHLTYRRPSRDETMMAKFVRVDDMSTSVDSIFPRSGPPPADKKIFPMFIELARERDLSLNAIDSASIEQSPGSIGVGPRVSFSSGRKRWSVTSLRSIDSADLASPMSVHDNLADRLVGFGEGKNGTCSKLGEDLLAMFNNKENADVTVVTAGQQIQAHRCVLSTVCPYFNAMFNGDWIENQKGIVELKGFSEPVVMFALCFMYGGLVDIPDDVNIWELLSLADMLQLDDLKNVVYLHIKGKICHFFHKPCAGCVTHVLECLPLLKSYGLRDLLSKSAQWQAKYFSRIWKTKVFNQMNDDSLDICFRAVVDSINAPNVMEILLGCEKLQMTLPKNKSAEAAAGLVACLFDTCLEFLASNFDVVLGCESFLNLGKGFALNLSLFEDLLPSVVHSLTPDIGCKALVKLYDILIMISSQRQAGDDDWNEKFVILLKRLYELCDTHLIHYASAVISCENWSMLSLDMQQRIKETGIFIEIQKPKAPPPKLSSLNRTYKRSASSGDRGVRERGMVHKRLIKPASRENVNKELHASNGKLDACDNVSSSRTTNLEHNGLIEEVDEEQPKVEGLVAPDTSHPSQPVASTSKHKEETAQKKVVKIIQPTKPVDHPKTATTAKAVQKPIDPKSKVPQASQSKTVLKRSHEMEELHQLADAHMTRSAEMENMKLATQPSLDKISITEKGPTDKDSPCPTEKCDTGDKKMNGHSSTSVESPTVAESHTIAVVTDKVVDTDKVVAADKVVTTVNNCGIDEKVHNVPKTDVGEGKKVPDAIAVIPECDKQVISDTSDKKVIIEQQQQPAANVQASVPVQKEISTDEPLKKSQSAEIGEKKDHVISSDKKEHVTSVSSTNVNVENSLQKAPNVEKAEQQPVSTPKHQQKLNTGTGTGTFTRKPKGAGQPISRKDSYTKEPSARPMVESVGARQVEPIAKPTAAVSGVQQQTSGSAIPSNTKKAGTGTQAKTRHVGAKQQPQIHAGVPTATKQLVESGDKK